MTVVNTVPSVKQKLQRYNLDSNNTCWIFLAGNADISHINDIIFGVYALRNKKVPDKNILIFSDHPTDNINYAEFGVGPNVFHTSEFIAKVKEIDGFAHLVLVVTGHGAINGIGYRDRRLLSPEKIISTVRSCNNLRLGILVLGQCYAGIFNFYDARKDPNICILGSTNLHMSLSSGVTLEKPIVGIVEGTILNQWSANIFLLNFFTWIVMPKDIDGDGEFSLMDAYKYSGVSSNAELREAKGDLAKEMDTWLIEERAKLKHSDTLGSAIENEKREAVEITIEKNLTILHLQQEPWLLYADLAREVIFEA